MSENTTRQSHPQDRTTDNKPQQTYSHTGVVTSTPTIIKSGPINVALFDFQPDGRQLSYQVTHQIEKNDEHNPFSVETLVPGERIKLTGVWNRGITTDEANKTSEIWNLHSSKIDFEHETPISQSPPDRQTAPNQTQQPEQRVTLASIFEQFKMGYRSARYDRPNPPPARHIEPPKFEPRDTDYDPVKPLPRTNTNAKPQTTSTNIDPELGYSTITGTMAGPSYSKKTGSGNTIADLFVTRDDNQHKMLARMLITPSIDTPELREKLDKLKQNDPVTLHGLWHIAKSEQEDGTTKAVREFRVMEFTTGRETNIETAKAKTESGKKTETIDSNEKNLKMIGGNILGTIGKNSTGDTVLELREPEKWKQITDLRIPEKTMQSFPDSIRAMIAEGKITGPTTVTGLWQQREGENWHFKTTGLDNPEINTEYARLGLTNPATQTSPQRQNTAGNQIPPSAPETPSNETAAPQSNPRPFTTAPDPNNERIITPLRSTTGQITGNSGRITEDGSVAFDYQQDGNNKPKSRMVIAKTVLDQYPAEIRAFIHSGNLDGSVTAAGTWERPPGGTWQMNVSHIENKLLTLEYQKIGIDPPQAPKTTPYTNRPRRNQNEQER